MEDNYLKKIIHCPKCFNKISTLPNGNGSYSGICPVCKNKVTTKEKSTETLIKIVKINKDA